MSGVLGGVAAVFSVTLLALLIGKPKPQKQRLGDISQQTAKEGDPRTIVWGRVRPIGGNIIHCQEPQKFWSTQKVSGGKGGSKKKEQKVEQVRRTYAIGVCEGPITRFARIWRNNKLVYDGRDGSAWGAANNAVFLRSFRLYLGGWDQMPSPDLQAIWGAGNVPAYRGTAYMVSVDETLTDLGGSVPQWVFEVERAEGVYYTSKPYAVESSDEFKGQGSIASGVFRNTLIDTGQIELLNSGGGFLDSGIFRSTISELEVEAESFDSGGGFIDSGVFRSALNTFTAENESFDSGGGFIQSGVFRVGLISYNQAEFEAFDSGGASIIGGTHAIP
jgi:hypothetical protein